MRGILLAARGLGWRKGLTVALVAVSTLAIAVTTMLAVYLSAATEQILDQHLEHASRQHTGVSVAYQVTSEWTLAGFVRHGISATKQAQNAVDFLDHRAELAGRFARSVAAVDSGLVAIPLPGGTVDTRVVWRDGQCARLRFVSGRCPRRAGEVTIAADDAARYRVRLGDVLTNRVVGMPMRVTGLYDLRDPGEQYWFGRDYFQRLVGDPMARRPRNPRIFALFVPRSAVDRFAEYTAVADRGLAREGIDLADEAALVGALDTTRKAFATAPPAGPAEFSWGFATRLPEVLKGFDADRARVDRGGLIIGLQVLVIAWYVLYLLVTSSAEQRQAEIALAKLRGRSLPATLGFAAVQPALVLACAAPLGVVLGWLAGLFVCPLFLRPDVPVGVDLRALLAVLLVVSGGIVASALALAHVVRDPVAELLRRLPSVRRGPVAAVLGAVVCALALAGAYELRTLARPRATHSDCSRRAWWRWRSPSSAGRRSYSVPGSGRG